MRVQSDTGKVAHMNCHKVFKKLLTYVMCDTADVKAIAHLEICNAGNISVSN